jgi:DNA repair protein RecN (Recombination protein N)
VQAEFDDLIVRRDVNAQGRSRAFVNDTLVTAASLGEQTSPLVELHGQHEHQTLLDPQSHLALLDEFAGLGRVREQVAVAFREWKRLQAEFDAFQMDEREKAARLDLLTFQVGELEKAQLRAGEDEELETARRVLSSADKLQRLSGEAYAALYDSDEAALARLATVWKRIAELAEVDPTFLPHLEARDAIKSQLEDLAQTLRAYGDTIDASPARLQEVEDRLALLERLKRKHGPHLADVIAKRDTLTRQLDALRNADERRAGLEEETRRAREDFLKQARVLSRARRDAARQFGARIQALLGELAMGRAQFDVRFEADPPESAWSESGIDAAECYLSANVGEELRPLARIASGGELSRVMLAIRTLAAAAAPGKTLIFDEIDAGIGGRVADVVGKKLRALGGSFQVLCITHLPQIAAAGHVHFHISKRVTNGRTRTEVVRLDESGRVEELARMIGGAVPTDAARAAARELLGDVRPAHVAPEQSRGGESEQKTKAKAGKAKAKT